MKCADCQVRDCKIEIRFGMIFNQLVIRPGRFTLATECCGSGTRHIAHLLISLADTHGFSLCHKKRVQESPMLCCRIIYRPAIKNDLARLWFFERARILVRLDHGAGFVKHADDCAVRARVALGIIDGVGGLVIPQPAKR